MTAPTRVHVVIPEQTISYNEIIQDISDLPLSHKRFPLVRVMDEELAKRLVKTVIEENLCV